MSGPTKCLHSFKNTVTYAGLGLITLAIGFVVSWFWVDNQEHRFERDGVKTKAVILLHDTDFDLQSGVTKYSVYYQYLSIGNIAHMNKEEGVPYEYWNANPVGTLIDVTYLKDRPDISFINNLPHFQIEKNNAVAVALCASVAGATCLIISYVRGSKRKKLMLVGIETLGSAHTLEKVPQAGPRLLYQFRTDDNKIIEGYFGLSKSSQKLWEKRLRAKDVNIKIVYNPIKPSEHTVLDMPSRLL